MCSCSDAYILHPRKDLGRVGEGFARGSVLIMGLSVPDPSQNSAGSCCARPHTFLWGVLTACSQTTYTFLSFSFQLEVTMKLKSNI